jgi:omega-amidase
MWNCPYSNDSFPTYAEDVQGGASQSMAAVQSAAKSLGVLIIAGSIPERHGEKLYNTCCVFDVDGAILGSYR